MNYLEQLSGEYFYIMEVIVNGEKLYMLTKRAAVHFPDMGRMFIHKQSVKRYYKGSEFEKMNCDCRVLKYSKIKGIVD